MSTTAPRILIVDNDSLARRTLRPFLQDLKLQVIGEASSVRRAKEIIDALHPNVVILDNCLPDGDGLDVLSHIRSNHPTTQVVVLSSDARIEHVKRAVELGITGFVTKPFSPNKVLHHVKTAYATYFKLLHTGEQREAS